MATSPVILVVDDDELILAVLGELLSGMGYRHVCARDGAEGLLMASKHLPDVVLTDVNMPGTNGRELLRQLRDDPALAATQIVMMTGEPQSTSRRIGMDLGADDFLVKPFDAETLQRCIAARIQRSRIHWRVGERVLDELRGDLHHALPHEFFTPLGGIIGLAEVLEESFRDLGAEEVREMLGEIERCGWRLHRTLRNYLWMLDDKLLSPGSKPGRTVPLAAKHLSFPSCQMTEPVAGSFLATEELRRIAERAGFDAVGVARAQRAPHADSFHKWLAEGHHATMGWLERDPEGRCDPRRTLKGARSVIALAMNYYVPEGRDAADGPARGVVARYARGRDYHNLIRKRLRDVDRALTAFGGRQRLFVDSGPLLERDFAALSGLAWQGKSTIALNARLGTWFFLAAVTTTLEFEPDEPARNHCGKCTRCIAACPTGAIYAPYKLDARRCISYWTIEHEGSIPVALRRPIGGRIFGCDDCLEVCPWNRFARATREADFQARAASSLPLRAYIELDEQAFLDLFEGSPIRRTGYRGFLRNVCVALGNVGKCGDLPALRHLAAAADPLLAEHAQWAIAEIESRTQNEGRGERMVQPR